MIPTYKVSNYNEIHVILCKQAVGWFPWEFNGIIKLLNSRWSVSLNPLPPSLEMPSGSKYKQYHM